MIHPSRGMVPIKTQFNNMFDAKTGASHCRDSGHVTRSAEFVERINLHAESILPSSCERAPLRIYTGSSYSKSRESLASSVSSQVVSSSEPTFPNYYRSTSLIGLSNRKTSSIRLNSNLEPIIEEPPSPPSSYSDLSMKSPSPMNAKRRTCAYSVFDKGYLSRLCGNKKHRGSEVLSGFTEHLESRLANSDKADIRI